MLCLRSSHVMLSIPLFLLLLSLLLKLHAPYFHVKGGQQSRGRCDLVLCAQAKSPGRNRLQPALLEVAFGGADRCALTCRHHRRRPPRETASGECRGSLWVYHWLLLCRVSCVLLSRMLRPSSEDKNGRVFSLYYPVDSEISDSTSRSFIICHPSFLFN